MSSFISSNAQHQQSKLASRSPLQMEYQYSPLGPNQFRLLTLHPRFPDPQYEALQEERPISCTLKSYPRIKSPAYRALSYTWGDLSVKIPILVNNKTLRVTTNLFTALEHIREDNSAATFWIDAICINQEDDEEKSSQVKMMREIYDTAEHTRSWLGPAGEGTDAAIAELDRIGSYLVGEGLIEPMKEFFRLPATEVQRYKILETMVREGVAPLVDQAIGNTSQTLAFVQNACSVLSRDYWKRVWILQELIVSPHILFQCGKSTIDFPTLHASVCYMHLLGTQIITRELERIGGLENLDPQSTATFNFAISLSTHTDSISNSTKLCGARLRYQGDATGETSDASQYPKLGSSMFELLARIHVTGATKTFCGATESRDRIFALLGIANDRDRLGIQPDYDQSKRCSEIYAEAARAIIQSGRVDLLSLSQPQGRDTDMPSWAPDWRAEWILRPSGQLPWDSSFKAFCLPVVSSDLDARIMDEKNSADQLRLRGYAVDVIEEVGRTWTPPYLEGYPGESSIPLIAAYLADIANFCKKSEKKFSTSRENIYANDLDRVSAHKRVPVADQEEYGTGFIRRAGKNSDEGYEHIKQHCMIAASNATDITPEQTQHFTHPLRNSYCNMMNWQRDRRPFLSKKGYVGLAPLHAQVGDVIVLFENANFPYILRDYGDGTYAFIGEAYVHGIMYGEYVKGNTGRGDLTTFTLV